MKPMTEGKSFPFDAFPLDERIDLVAHFETYYCLFSKTVDGSEKYGLFKNNLAGSVKGGRLTESYTAIGKLFGYDEVKVCPTGVYPDATFAMFIALTTHNPETCQILSASMDEGCHILATGKNIDECVDALKEMLGVRLEFGTPDYFWMRRHREELYGDIPSADALLARFNGKYTSIDIPRACSFGDEQCEVMAIVEKQNGRNNYLNVRTGEELSPVDFDGYSLIGESGDYLMEINGVWMMADLHGVAPDYKLHEMGWYSYECLPSYLAGEDISKYWQIQYESVRKDYIYVDPQKNNPKILLELFNRNRDLLNEKKTADAAEREDLYRKKISGWYSKKEYEDKAIARLLTQRQEIIDLLNSTGREGISNVVRYLDDSGFFYRASSPSGHHNFPGGLAEHSLGTYYLAKERGAGLPADSVIICALLHDICKADRFWFKGRSICKHTPKCEADSKHSVRSILILNDCGLKLTEQERRAIRWHMKGEYHHPHNPREIADHDKAIKENLWRAVFYADKADAAAHPGRAQ